ncbi:unnamed protein product [Parascedosporium putredinis]|uniref:Phosphoglycerate mutase n=1 Tax=Parascedosporium putredinis TaxID=1442378 RepID=A0A9P1GZX0_9PEZI|nr:unnamed protein product [Parascedosporium putredinis]CAI7993353.1 unnamed protein product [Parascedosporium putredinis]
MKSYSLLSAVVMLGQTASAAWTSAADKSIVYSSVPGFFLQDDNTTSPTGFDYATVNFGLIDRAYPTDKRFDPEGTASQWERFEYYVASLNSGCRPRDNVRYKVLFMGRHGEGWHNAAESFYGTPAWNCYWAEQTGNGTAVWADPLLTPAGEYEAYKANAYFKDRYETQNMPHFESYYSSPYRGAPSRPTSPSPTSPSPRTAPSPPKTDIAALFPSYRFEDGFSEEDELWHSYEAETTAAQAVRAKTVLDDVFRGDDTTWISVTSHSGQITQLLAALNHRAFRLSTGQIIPVLVKATLADPRPAETVEAYEPYSTCEAPPVTSVAGQGCVCEATTAGVPMATAVVPRRLR